MRRIVSVWLPTFATDRQNPRPPRAATPSEALPPRATVASGRGGLCLVAVNAEARAGGLIPDLPLADARAVLPHLMVHTADPAGDRAALCQLAAWCGRYTPWTATDDDSSGNNAFGGGHFGGGAGLWLDIGGAAHLQGGERPLLEELRARLAGFGFGARIAVAATAGAAWALARFSGDPLAILDDDPVDALATLPIEALRLPAVALDGLHRVGLRRIGDLAPLPRAPLAARFGEATLARLDQALGRQDEPLSPLLPQPALFARLAFVEPIGRTDDITTGLAHLLAETCDRLAATHQGARRLVLALYRSDGTVGDLAVGTSRPLRSPKPLARLFSEKLDGFDAGFGLDAITLSVLAVDPLPPSQRTIGFENDDRGEDLAQLIDRLGNRLGSRDVVRLGTIASHIPEQAQDEISAFATLPPSAAAAQPTATEELHLPRLPRPLELLPWPEAIEVIAPVPDGPPAAFRWRRIRYRVAAAEGPERIAPEWWRMDEGLDPDVPFSCRDYWRIEDEAGRRFWIYREGLYRPDRPPRWFLHGLFA